MNCSQPLNTNLHLREIIPSFLPHAHQSKKQKMEQNYEVPRDRIIHSPSYPPVLLHYPVVPSRFLGEATCSMQRKWYESVHKPGVGIGFSYVVYYENHNKCYYFADASGLKLTPLAAFPSIQTSFFVKTDPCISLNMESMCSKCPCHAGSSEMYTGSGAQCHALLVAQRMQCKSR